VLVIPVEVSERLPASESAAISCPYKRRSAA
jgi:hypothetical protein